MDTTTVHELEHGADAERIRHPKRNVVIVLFRRGNQILLVRTHKLPGSWQPVGGGMEPVDTTPEAAAVREIHEELGFHLTEDQLTHVTDLPYDFGDGTVHCYTATWPSENPDPEVNKNEIIDHLWCTLPEAQKLPTFPATKTFLTLLAK